MSEEVKWRCLAVNCYHKCVIDAVDSQDMRPMICVLRSKVTVAWASEPKAEEIKKKPPLGNLYQMALASINIFNKWVTVRCPECDSRNITFTLTPQYGERLSDGAKIKTGDYRSLSCECGFIEVAGT